MKTNIFLTITTILLLTGLVSGAQPKILEVTDNLGHTFTFKGGDSENVNVGMEDDWASAIIKDEIEVTENTKITLCVTKVKAQNKEELTYSYRYGSGADDHKANTEDGEKLNSNCNTWNLNKSHYQSEWRFSVWTRNDDDIYYQNDVGKSDFKASIHYKNLVLEDSGEESQSYNYETVKLSKTEYQKLKESKNETNVPQDKKVVSKSEWSEMKSEIEDKQNRIESLRNKIKELNNTVFKLKNKPNNLQEGKNDQKESQGSAKTNTQENTQTDSLQEEEKEQKDSQESDKGFFGKIIGFFT